MRLFRRNDVVEAPERCAHVLVRHADGTDECEGAHRCAADELVHDWELSCAELGCGCVGEAQVVLVAA